MHFGAVMINQRTMLFEANNTGWTARSDGWRWVAFGLNRLTGNATILVSSGKGYFFEVWNSTGTPTEREVAMWRKKGGVSLTRFLYLLTFYQMATLANFLSLGHRVGHLDT